VYEMYVRMYVCVCARAPGRLCMYVLLGQIALFWVLLLFVQYLVHLCIYIYLCVDLVIDVA